MKLYKTLILWTLAKGLGNYIDNWNHPMETTTDFMLDISVVEEFCVKNKKAVYFKKEIGFAIGWSELWPPTNVK